MKQFAIFKNDKKEKDTQPDFILKGKIDGKSLIIGKGWKKQAPDGSSYISVALSDVYNEYSGFRLVEEKSKQAVEEVEPEAKPGDDINPEDIPFI